MHASGNRQSNAVRLPLAVPPLPVDLEFKPNRVSDIFRKHNLVFGRCFGSKSAYRLAHPNCKFIPNANVFSKRDGKIWWGDLDLARDKAVLEDVARRLRCRLYVLSEFNGRFDEAARPHAEIVRDAVWHTGRQTRIPGARRFFQRSGLSLQDAGLLLRVCRGRFNRPQKPATALEISRRLKKFEEVFRPIASKAGHKKWGLWWTRPLNKLNGRSPLEVMKAGETLDLGELAGPTVQLMLFSIQYGVMKWI